MKSCLSFLFVTIQIKHTYGELITMFIFFLERANLLNVNVKRKSKEKTKRSVKSFVAVLSITLYLLIVLGFMREWVETLLFYK